MDLESGAGVGAARARNAGFYAPAIGPGGNLLAIARGPRTVLYTPHDGKRQFAVRSHGPVYMIEFSADGKLLLTAGSENTARVWDIRTHRKLAVLRGHTGVLEDVAFSPDSRLVITGSDDGTARVWDARTGELLDAVRQDAARPASSVSFTSDSRRFLAASDRIGRDLHLHRLRDHGRAARARGRAARTDSAPVSQPRADTMACATAG